MRVLVTGGAGYIGSHTMRILQQRGYEPLALDNLSSGHRSACGSLPLFVADVRDGAAVRQVLDECQPEAVIHFAASALVGESVASPLDYYHNNVAGLLSLLQAMAGAGVGRIVFSSSAAVYGEPEVRPIPESAPLAPVNPYGRSKLIGEQMLADAAQASDLRFVALRYFNAAGAAPEMGLGEDHQPETHLVPCLLRAALQGNEFQVFGSDYPTRDGSCERDFVHVLDLAEAHVLALEQIDDQPNRTYNLGTGRGITVLEMLAAAEEALGESIPHRLAGRRPGDPPSLVADGSRARRDLGWEPERSDVEQIIASSLQFMREHPHGYGD